MKGILLAGGAGTRLHPVTKAVNKHLLPIYDKPMIHYPLSTLMLAGITDILLISTPKALPRYEDLLGDGSEIGIDITYAEQAEPNGIAEAFLIGEDFIGTDDVMLVLGDNVFYGHNLSTTLQDAVETHEGATIFAHQVSEPERYGVLDFDGDAQEGSPRDIIEKPEDPPSEWAVTGMYLYDNDVVQIAKNLEPSDRGELEITDVNRAYLNKDLLDVVRLGRGYAWLDTGTHDALMDASRFIAAIQKRQGKKVACLEEVAWQMGYIDEQELAELADRSNDGEYLAKLAERATAHSSSPTR